MAVCGVWRSWSFEPLPTVSLALVALLMASFGVCRSWGLACNSGFGDVVFGRVSQLEFRASALEEKKKQLKKGMKVRDSEEQSRGQ